MYTTGAMDIEVPVRVVSQKKREKEFGVSVNSILVCLVCTFTCASKCHSCPTESELDDILKFGNIYFGELHGTKETSEFYECLID